MVIIARGIHLFPFRTQKLSLSAPQYSGRMGEQPGCLAEQHPQGATSPGRVPAAAARQLPQAPAKPTRAKISLSDKEFGKY